MPADRKPRAGSRRQTAAVALAPALRPVVDLCLELGITSPEMERILRGVFVQQAERLLSAGRSAGPHASDLRIGLMTGVHRNFVREIRATKPSVRLQKVQQRHRGDALLQAWATDWHYLTAAGSPRDLPIQAPEGEPCFARLVAQHMSRVPIRTAIAELRRSSAIRLLPDEQVRLRSRSARPPGITEASIAAASARLSDLTATEVHNLKTPEQRLFCESIDALRIDPRRLALVRQTIAKRAQNFLDLLAEELAPEATFPSTGPTVSIGLTVFGHERSPGDPGVSPRGRRGTKA